MRPSRYTSAIAALGCLLACSAGVDDDWHGQDGGGAGVSGDANTAGSATTAGSPGSPSNPGGAGSTAAPGPELCDGVDNDGDGAIDDVDAQGDGICDCLRVATIGQIGPWSDGANVFRDWLGERSSTPVVELGDQVLTDELLRPFQVIVVLYTATEPLNDQGRMLAAHHAFSSEETAAFERWVRGGGGVMTTIGYSGDETSEIASVNRLLAPLGLSYSTTKRDLSGFVTEWLGPHPVTDMVSKIYTENGVEPDGPSGMTLARDAAGHVALQAAQLDSGRAIVWGDEWITYDSQWRAVEDQQVERLWLNMLKWMSPERICQVTLPGPD